MIRDVIFPSCTVNKIRNRTRGINKIRNRTRDINKIRNRPRDIDKMRNGPRDINKPLIQLGFVFRSMFLRLTTNAIFLFIRPDNRKASFSQVSSYGVYHALTIPSFYS